MMSISLNGIRETSKITITTQPPFAYIHKRVVIIIIKIIMEQSRNNTLAPLHPYLYIIFLYRIFVSTSNIPFTKSIIKYSSFFSLLWQIALHVPLQQLDGIFRFFSSAAATFSAGVQIAENSNCTWVYFEVSYSTLYPLLSYVSILYICSNEGRK